MRNLNDISLGERDHRAIQAAAATLRELFPVERVILFGSKARGVDDTESDIDLLVLTSRLMSHAEQSGITKALLGLELELDVVISPLIVSTEDWEHGLYQVLPIRHEITRDGVVV